MGVQPSLAPGRHLLVLFISIHRHAGSERYIIDFPAMDKTMVTRMVPWIRPVTLLCQDAQDVSFPLTCPSV